MKLSCPASYKCRSQGLGLSSDQQHEEERVWKPNWFEMGYLRVALNLIVELRLRA